MKKKILIISHNFPPDFSSGILRTLSFAENLQTYGWNVEVLTSKRFFQKNKSGKFPDKLDGVQIKRISYIDGKKDLGFKGKHISLTDCPDSYLSWFLFSLFFFFIKGRSKRNIGIIFSTYPVASSHLLGWALSKLLKRPWIADFRDPMLQKNIPKGTLNRKIWKWIENRVVNNAAYLIFTTQSARESYLSNYPELSPKRCVCIPNGYNEDRFQYIKESQGTDNELRIVHAGGLYPDGRNPIALFRALKKLLDILGPEASLIKIEFYGSGSAGLVDLLEQEVQTLRLKDNVHFFSGIPHEQMLQKLADADVLLILQGACFDRQVPGKIYEYFRLEKPILALATQEGETGRLVRSTNSGFVVDQEDESEIFETLKTILSGFNNNQSLPRIPKERLPEFSREEQARKLSNILQDSIKKGGN